MKLLTICLILILLPVLLYGQAVNETFSNFNRTAFDSSKAMWRLDSLAHTHAANDSLQDDLVGSADIDGFDGWADAPAVYNSFNTASPNFSGSKVVGFATNLDMYLATAGDGDPINPDSTDFTMIGWIRSTSSVATGQNVFWKNALTGIQTLYMVSVRRNNDGANSNKLQFTAGTNGGSLVTLYGNSAIAGDALWHHFACGRDTDDTLRMWIDGIVQTAADELALDISTSDNLYIGNRETASEYFGGDISEVHFVKRYLTEQEIREDAYLALGWYSNAGKVYRESRTGFAQGLYDSETVFYPLANTNASWLLTFNAWGGKSGDVVTVNVGDQTGVAQTLTGSSVEYTLNLGYEVTSSDSLYFVASAGDTVYIDNAVLTADTTPDIYVSDQGNDSNLGTSVLSPYLTLAKAYGLTLPAGSTVYLFSSDEWRETWTQGVSGTPGNPITISAVDSTGESGANPIVNLIDVNNKDYITISNCITVTYGIRNTGTGYLLDVSECPLFQCPEGFAGFPKFPAYNTFLSGIGGSTVFPYIFPFCLE